MLTALFFALQIVDHFLSRKYDADEAEQQQAPQRGTSTLRLWVKATPPDKSFSVLMPRRPRLMTNYLSGPFGKVPTIQLGCTDGGRAGEAEVYIAALTEFPTNADLSNKEAIHDKAQAGFGEKLGALRREGPVTLQGIEGRETEVEALNGTNLLVQRIFISDRRLVQLTAAVPLTRGPSSNTWRFLDSLCINTNSVRTQSSRSE